MIAALLRAASAWRDPNRAEGVALRRRLRETSLLSTEGIELALTEHLETNISPEDLAEMRRRAAPHAAPVVHVMLAGNVCVAALRAVAFALACANEVVVRPSRRDPALAEAIAEVCPAVTLTDALHPEPDHSVHLYGSDETLDGLVVPGRVLRFGSGFGVAVVHDEVDGVVQDLVAFDGAGCISPRVIVAHDPERTLDALHEGLAASTVPRGALRDDDRAALARARITYAAVGSWRQGHHHALALDPSPEAMTLLPPLRAALVVPAEGVERWLPAEGITVIGGEGPMAERLGRHAPLARRARLGFMQRPPLDGPVDLRPLGARDRSRPGP